VIAAIAGDRVAIVDSATATASALVELLAINGLESPGTTRGTAADAGAAGHDRPDETAADATHVQLTTGDVDAFRAAAERIFGEAFPDVGSVEVGRIGDASVAS
jgi:glutamate racemase